jgi:choline dehydrogenase-like flavoprotein
LDSQYFPIASSRGKSLFHQALDALLNFYPIPKRRDRCRSAACHRTSFSSGLLSNHENLNRHTHDNIDRFFAGTPTSLLEHVARMGTYGGCLDNDLNHLITEKSLARLRDLPILFVSGADNEVFDPETTLRDYELLRRRFGEKMYRRFWVKGYGAS